MRSGDKNSRTPIATLNFSSDVSWHFDLVRVRDLLMDRKQGGPAVRIKLATELRDKAAELQKQSIEAARKSKLLLKQSKVLQQEFKTRTNARTSGSVPKSLDYEID